MNSFVDILRPTSCGLSTPQRGWRYGIFYALWRSTAIDHFGLNMTMHVLHCLPATSAASKLKLLVESISRRAIAPGFREETGR